MKSIRRAVTLAGYAGLTLASTLTARGAILPPDVPPDFPAVKLPARMRGEAAIEQVGPQLREVARYYRMTEGQLKAALRKDKDLWVDRHGRLLYICNMEPIAPGAEDSGGPLSATLLSDDMTFRLHSRPGASKIVYLDFDGYDASWTSWGDDAIGKPFDKDGNPGVFSSSELADIRSIWQRVSEDYAMYDVDITTEDPGVEALRRSPSNDENYGIRVVISGSGSDWYGSAGGVAYLNSFNWTTDTPCWVFPESLSSNEKNIAEATSHEVGHTLSLHHDGRDVNDTHTEYYSGHGQWAPIMGNSYARPISQWSIGEYAYANNTEDDLSRMLNYGPIYRADDFGNSLGQAETLVGVQTEIAGIVERNTDVDFFKFQAGAGPLNIRVDPAPAGPNLHLLVTLHNAAGTVIGTANPADTSAGVQPAFLSPTLPAGTYYLSVQGTGSGDPLNTGYSAYGSIGQYTVRLGLPGDSAWIATAPGTGYTWANAANWASNSFPWGADAIARLNNNIAGQQTISLNAPITLGQLILGDLDNSHAFRLESGLGGMLVFQSTSGSAQVIKSTGADDTIAASISLGSDLAVIHSGPGSLTFEGQISGSGSLTKAGSGVLLLTSAATYSGDTTLSGGTAVLASGTSLGSANIRVDAGATLDVTAGGLLLSGQQLLGHGNVNGNVTVQNGSTINPGVDSVAGTIVINGDLTMQSGSRLAIGLSNKTVVGAGTNDLVSVEGNLDLSGIVQVDLAFLEDFPASPGTYTLILYGGTLTGGASNLQVSSMSTRYNLAFDDSFPGEIRLLVSGAPAGLVWSGDGTQNLWESDGAANFRIGAAPANFHHLDDVSFDDSGLPGAAVNLVGALYPAAVQVNGAQDYTFAGSGKLSGNFSLTKTGSGTLTINTANDYTGPTLVSSGLVKAGNATAFGGSESELTLSAGAMLDLNGFSLGAKPARVAGSGINGAGAIVNDSVVSQPDAIQFLTLSAHTTLGGERRWDVRAAPTGALEGNNYNLTKVGPNEIWLANLGDTSLGGINIMQGTLGVEGSTTLGNPAGSLTVGSGATLALRNTHNNLLSKNLVLQDGFIDSSAGNNVLAGTLALNGSNVVSASSILALQTAVTGPGSLAKTGSGILSLAGNNGHSGATLVIEGTLQIQSDTALGSAFSGTTIFPDARLDINGRNLGAEPVTVSGDGLGDAGAIVNTGNQQLNALRFVVLAGPTTLGGTDRWDIRANPTGSLAGNNFALTKTGRNEIWLADLGETQLGSIIIKEGRLGFRGSTKMGNASTTLSVTSDGSLGFYANEGNILSKVLSLNGGHVYNGSGNNIFSGPGTLASSNAFNTLANTRLTMTGPLSGSGSLNLYGSSSGTLVLAGNNTYSGGTRITTSTLQVGNGFTGGTLGTGGVVNNGKLILARNTIWTVGNNISGSGSLEISVVDPANPYIGSTLTLTGNNSYSGGTTLNGNGNLLAIASDTAIGTGTLTFAGNANGNSVAGIRSANGFARTIANRVQLGACDFFQFGTLGTGELIFDGPPIITDNEGKTLMISNAITTIRSVIGNNSRIIKTGPGALVLSGNNTNNGFSILMGTIRADSEPRLGRNPAFFTPDQLLLDGGTLQTTATFSIDDSNRGLQLGASGGAFNVNAGTTLTLARPISGPGSLTKLGAGTLVLTGAHTYSGATTNALGTLIVNGTLRGAGVNVAGGSLSGNGTIHAPVMVSTGGSFEPGASPGTLTISNSLLLAGTAVFDLDKAPGTNDLVRGLTSVTYGGVLTLNFLSGSLQEGDSFKLFEAESYTGAFTQVLPQEPGPGLAWNLDRLLVDGTLQVAASRPIIVPAMLTEGALWLSGCGGQPATAWTLLGSTNLTLPPETWDILAEGFFDETGCFNITNAMDPLLPARFYMLKTSTPALP